MKWIKEVENLGAGEIMLTSIDKEGTKSGFDIKLNEEAAKIASIPLIVCGGAGSKEDCNKSMLTPNVDATAIASILHYQIDSIADIKKMVFDSGIKIRL